MDVVNSGKYVLKKAFDSYLLCGLFSERAVFGLKKNENLTSFEEKLPLRGQRSLTEERERGGKQPFYVSGEPLSVLLIHLRVGRFMLSWAF